MQFQQSLHTHWAQNGRISTTQFHNLKYLEGNCMRNLSPGDERQPQGLRAHIHTFTMRAFSDSSAKKVRPLRPIPQQFRKKTRPAHPHQHHTRYKTRPTAPFPPHVRDKTRPTAPFPPHVRDKTRPTRNTPGHCGTKLALRTPSHCMRGTKLALLAQNGPIWRVLTAHGELSTAVTTNKPRRANFFTLTPTPGRAGEFLLRAQPPLRLGILPLTSTPPSWRRPSSSGKINKQPPPSASTIRQ